MSTALWIVIYEAVIAATRLTESQRLIRSRDDKESNPAGPEGEKDEERALTLLS